VEIYRDLGSSLELKSGLEGGEKVVLGAPVDLADGGKVKVAAPDKGDKGGANQKGRNGGGADFQNFRRSLPAGRRMV
jgi:hypothetical protein